MSASQPQLAVDGHSARMKEDLDRAVRSATSTSKRTLEILRGRGRGSALMLKQIDHRGKHFTISDENSVDDVARERCRRAEMLERQAQRESRELERAKVVAGPAGKHPDVEVLER